MDYRPIEEAKRATGLRLALTGGVPAPWSESAKGLFRVRGVDYIAVMQHGGEANEELVSWTGYRNAPTALFNDEPPRVTALDMVNLAERLGSGPSLVPAAIADRVQMFGLLNEIAGEGGFAWNARIVMFHGMARSQGADAVAGNPMFRDYRYTDDDVPEAPARMIAVLDALAARLHAQRAEGSSDDVPYFFAGTLSALDIYWACFSQMLAPLPPAVNPMPSFLRELWSVTARVLAEQGYEADPILFEHRDAIFPRHLQWPLDF